MSYEVEVVGRIRRAIEAATADDQAQAAALDLASTTVAAAVVGAYTDVCAAGASLAVAEHSVALQRRSLGLTERGVHEGLFPSPHVPTQRDLLSHPTGPAASREKGG